jgi:Lipocalin-like domain
MKKLIVLASVLMIIVSCSRGGKDHPACNINAATISGVYKITAYTYKVSPSSQPIDYYQILYPDACDRDNVFTFNTDGTYELKDIGQVCTPEGGDAGSWTLAGNKLDMDGLVLSIENFDCKKLELSFTGLLTVGDKMKVTFLKQ